MSSSTPKAEEQAPERLFETLGMAPSNDPNAVKRAYFAALKRHPPHSDPEGFRRLRQAYERLSHPSVLAAAYVTASVDVEAELAQYEAELGPLLAPAERAVGAELDAAMRNRRRVESVSALTLARALERFSPRR